MRRSRDSRLRSVPVLAAQSRARGGGAVLLISRGDRTASVDVLLRAQRPTRGLDAEPLYSSPIPTHPLFVFQPARGRARSASVRCAGPSTLEDLVETGALIHVGCRIDDGLQRPARRWRSPARQRHRQNPHRLLPTPARLPCGRAPVVIGAQRRDDDRRGRRRARLFDEVGYLFIGCRRRDGRRSPRTRPRLLPTCALYHAEFERVYRRSFACRPVRSGRAGRRLNTHVRRSDR